MGPRRFVCDRGLRSSSRRFLNWYHVLYSLDGLLVMWHPPGLFIVCNPATRQWTNLPVLNSEPCCYIVFPCGFYSHGGPSSREYRLLCHCLEKEVDASGWRRKGHYYILSLSAAAAAPPPPRRLPVRAPPLSPGTDYSDLPVSRRGVLHWFSDHPEAADTGKMLAFDTVSETFRLMARPPPEEDGSSSWTRALFQLDDDELGVVAMRDETFSLHIWELRDYDAEIWTLRHRVERMQPPPPMKYFAVTAVIPMGNGFILMGSPSCGLARLYNLRDNKVYRDIVICPAYPTFLVFSDSLLPISLQPPQLTSPYSSNPLLRSCSALQPGAIHAILLFQ